jgi:serine/threonine-protein kinase
MDYFRAPNIKNQISSDLVGLHSRFRKVFESLCLALGYMHEKGWVHRDIKPENILSNKVGELRLIDFSLSVKSAGGQGKLLGARTKAVQGTRTYIAPETLLKKSATFQTDMYSLGITVFEILTGNPPFRGMSPGELLRMHVQDKAAEVSSYNKNVTPEMDRLVARMLSKKPDKRHKNMEEIYAEFRSLKVFIEDPKDIDARRQEARKEAELSSLGASDRINSRRDHKRSEAGLTPETPPQKPKPAPPKPQSAPPRETQPQYAPAGQPQAGQGYGPPGMPPGAPYPNYPPGGFAYPPSMQPPPGGYAYPPGMQPPPGYQPGMPLPPGYPQQQPMPNQQPNPQQAPAPQQPPAPAPAAQQPKPSPPPTAAPAAPQPAKPETKPTKKQEEEDLPLMEMDELPDVL